MIDNQIRFDEIDESYKDFVEKFKPKKTTDDCYTPEPIYEAIAEYVSERYGILRKDMLRPFYPGEDYRRREYPAGCCVVDNPPFSIISQIVNDYISAGVPFFLFAPYLTCFTIRGCTHIVCDADITYENGAVVNTCFVTSLEPGVLARTGPELAAIIKDANESMKTSKQLPKYKYPVEVVTAAMLGYMAKYGIEYEIKEEDAYFIRSLDSQRAVGKTIFGSGYLISEKAAAEKAAAEKAAAIPWTLSEREKDIIRQLGRR